MIEPHSTLPPAPDKPQKPAKPDPKYPLTAHPAGPWFKLVQGKWCCFDHWGDTAAGPRRGAVRPAGGGWWNSKAEVQIHCCLALAEYNQAVVVELPSQEAFPWETSGS